MYLYVILAIVGAISAVTVAAAALYTALQARRGAKEQGAWRRWTVLDYVVCGLFAAGALLLLADIVAVRRDGDGSAFHHYGYLLSAFVYMTSGMLYMVVRLGLLLSSTRAAAGSNAHTTGEAASGTSAAASPATPD